jgi:hypothetical protein
MSGKPIEEARAEALAARAQLVETLGELQQRFSPRYIASEALKDAQSFVEEVTEDAVRIALKRPGLSIALAGIAMVAIARGPLWTVIADRILKRHATRE